MMRLIFALVLGGMLLFPTSVFAADVQVSGKVLDQMNNPIPNGAVVFTDQNGKTVKAATTDISGAYDTNIANGTYSISVTGPRETSLGSAEMDNVALTQSTTLDFILKAPEVSNAQKPTVLQQVTPYAIGGGILAAFGIGGLLFYRRKKVSAQSSSSD